MSSVNIPSSLKTISQKPLDAKTQRDTLIDLTTFNDSDAYSFWAGMEVRVSENNKKYIWKEVTSEPPVSSTFTYPSGHVVDSYNYSNKTFAFYEIVNSDSSNVYKTSVFNVPPSPAWWIYNPLDNQAGMIYKSIENVVDEDTNQVTQRIGLASILSNTLTVRNSVYIGEDNDIYTNALHIDYFDGHKGKVIVGDITPDELIPNDDLVVLPDADGNINIKGPIKGPIKLKFPEGGKVKLPISGALVDPGSISNVTIEIGKGKILETTHPIINGSVSNGKLNIKGGTISYKPISTGALFDIDKSVGSFDLDVEDVKFVSIDSTSSSILKGRNIDSAKFTNVKIDSTNGTDFDVENSQLKINNLRGTFNTSSKVSFVNARNSSDVKIENAEFIGEAATLVSVSSTNPSVSPKVIISNSDLTELNIADEIFKSDDPSNIAANFIKLNNTEISTGTTISNSITNIRKSNIVDDTPPPVIDNIDIDGVDGLRQALDDKANEQHTHPISQVDGLNMELENKLSNRLNNLSPSLNDSDLEIFRNAIRVGVQLLETNDTTYNILLNGYAHTILVHSHEPTESAPIALTLPDGDFDGQLFDLEFLHRDVNDKSSIVGNFLLVATSTVPFADVNIINSIAADTKYRFIWSVAKDHWVVTMSNI